MSISEMIPQMGLDFPQPLSAMGILTSPGISWEEKWGEGWQQEQNPGALCSSSPKASPQKESRVRLSREQGHPKFISEKLCSLFFFFNIVIFIIFLLYAM